MVVVTGAGSKNWLFGLYYILNSDQAYKTFLKKTLKWKDVSARAKVFYLFHSKDQSKSYWNILVYSV